MEKATKLFLISTVFLLIATSGISYKFYTDNKALKQEITSLNQKLESKSKNLETNILEVDNKITGRINTFYSDYEDFKGQLTGQVSTLTTNINTVSTQSQQQYQSLSGQLTEVATKSEELETQLSKLDFKDADFSNIIEDAIKSVVSVHTNKGIGSGVIVDDAGYVITNYHVLEGATGAAAITYDNEVHKVALAAFDKNLDLALIKIYNGYP